ncbi:MAG: galactokinase [Verrucomicrobiales bacterium]
MPAIDNLTASAQAHFSKVFGRAPVLSACAPGRVNLIGEHVDYQDGLVTPFAINRYVVAAAAAISEPEARIWSSTCSESPLVVDLERDTPLEADNAWANYVFGVIAAYRKAGHDPGGFEIAFDCDLPAGAGLSSSAALESATALIIEALVNIELPAKERAQLCQQAEHEYAGVPCGIMDQLAVNCGLAGHALFIDCRTLDISPFLIPGDLAMVVIDSRVKHSLADGEYARRKDDCEAAAEILGVQTLRKSTIGALEEMRQQLGEQLYRRAHHVVSEIARVKDFTAAMESGNPGLAGSLMNASHVSLRDDYEVSCTELDALVEIAGNLNALGSRMMGGGFGGSTISLVHSSEAHFFATQVVKICQQHHDWIPGAFVVSAVDGAACTSTP